MQIKNSFDPETLKKIGKGALIAGSGAVIVYLAEVIPMTDFGRWTPWITAISSILINVWYQYRRGETKIGS